MSIGSRDSLRDESHDCEFTIEEIRGREHTENWLRESFPWLEAESEDIRNVAWLAGFPRSISGQRQNDHLLRVLAREANPLNDSDLISIVRSASNQLLSRHSTQDEPDPSDDPDCPPLLRLVVRILKCIYPAEINHPQTASEFFQAIADRFRHLETYSPTAGDFAVQALQEVFVGLMSGPYQWGKKGLPTKGQVTQFAKEYLKLSGRNVRKGTWTDLLKEAGLKWLPPGKTGRPSKQQVDENIKTKKAFLSKQSKYVQEILGGNWSRLNDEMNRLYGGKKMFFEEEQARSREANTFCYPEEEQ